MTSEQRGGRVVSAEERVRFASYRDILTGRMMVQMDAEAYDDLRDRLDAAEQENAALREAAGDPDYSPAYQDEYQRLWHREAGLAKLYALALQRIDETRIPSDGEKSAAERAYFDVKAITRAALSDETKLAEIMDVPAAVEVYEARAALTASRDASEAGS